MQERFGIDLEANKNEFVFVVDAPNDALMSAYFPHSVGVANVKYSLDLLPAKPAYVTPSGYGNCFAELVDNLLAGK